MPGYKTSIVRFAGIAILLSLLAGACAPQNFVRLTADDNIAELADGILVSANPALLAADFSVQLGAIAADTFLNGQAGSAWEAALAALPPNLLLQSPVFQIKSRGVAPGELFVSLVTPASLDAGYDLYAWNGASWEFLPAQQRGGQLVATVSALPPVVAVFHAATQPPLAFVGLEPGHALTQNVAEAANGVLLGGVLAQADGSLGGQLPGVELGGSFAVYPVVRDRAAGEPPASLLAGLLADEAARATHLETLVSFAVAGGYNGLALDYAGVTPELAPAFAQFVHDLAAQMHAHGKSLYVQVPPPELSEGVVSTGGYDWRALGQAADALFISMPDDPAVFGSGWADAVLAWAVGEVPRSRVRLHTTALSVEAAEGHFALVDQASAIVPLGSVVLDAQGELLAGDPVAVKLSGGVQALAYDTQAFAASFSYDGRGGSPRTLWLTSADTLRQRLALAEKYRLGGIVVGDLLRPGVPPEMLNAITQYKVAMQTAALAQAELLWTVRSAAGVLALATAQPGQPYVYVVPEAGDYEFSANLQHGSTSGLGSLAVRVAAVTPTPEPTETAATVAQAAGGGGGGSGTAATPNPQAPATQAPPSGGGGFVPPPPVGAGTFQLGGQVPGFIANADRMKQAGMTWVKFQSHGDAGMVAAGHGAGFKVLVSVVGDRSRAADPGYWPEYAAMVAGIAAAGADAIEVWNEANIDREWPTGQISGATYTELLRHAYQAIKAANPGTMVISGAPAPTGAEGAFPGRVVNDDRFLNQMAAAGAANYMDCVGVHMNESIVSPKATAGDPRGYHHSYYFWPMVDTYYNAFGGSRPLCFTELGYLSPEGYGPLPPGFTWGSNVSVAQQAQWLAEAASLSGNSGKVRLMIVWNVDFTLYGADPQAGFAIVRPDGSCPACSALGSVVR
jgi:hypothetical protein